MFKGSYVAIVTPFRNGEVDHRAFRHLIERQLDGGTDGLVVCGTTGEVATLNDVERNAVIKAAVDTVNGRVPVIAGTGTNDTRVSIARTKEAKALGADGALLVAPYYNKPNQEGLYQHFSAIADAVEIPQVVYNVPGRTACKVSVETLARLSKHPNIVGTKDATADMVMASDTLAACEEGFLLLSGDDGTTFPFLVVGGHGTISVVANVAPKLMSDLCKATFEGRFDEARALHDEMIPLFHLLFSDTNPVPTKAALWHLGHVENESRLPLVAIQGAALETLTTTLERILK